MAITFEVCDPDTGKVTHHCPRCMKLTWQDSTRHNVHRCNSGLAEEDDTNLVSSYYRNHPNRLAAKGPKKWIPNLGSVYDGWACPPRGRREGQQRANSVRMGNDWAATQDSDHTE